MADWSMLPSDLVRRIAECLLATNDLDWYMDFRAVCPHWRSATDDPTNSSDLRFHPRQWIVIDEVVEKDSRLMVNTATGRIIRKDLPLLCKYYIVIVATNASFFVLADREHPHAARVLNPFTGHMVRFTAAVPYNLEVTSAALSLGSSPSLRLLSEYEVGDVDASSELYTADPDSECFTVYEEDYGRLMKRLAVLGGTCDDGELLEPMAPLSDAVAERIFDVVRLPKRNLDILLERSQITEHDLFPRYDLLESAGELILVAKLQGHLKVFRMNTDSIVMEPVDSIGNRAFFLGLHRYMSVNADKFPCIDADCIYYVRSTGSSLDIYKYSLLDEKEEMVFAYINSLHPSSVANPAFKILKVLCSYTNNLRTSQLTRNARSLNLTESGAEYKYAYGPGSCWCLNMIEVVDPDNFQRKPHCIRA